MKNYSLKKQRMLIILLVAFIPMIILPLYFEKLRLDIYIAEKPIFEDVYFTCSTSTEGIKLSYSEKHNSWYTFIPAHISNHTIQFSHKNTGLSLVSENGEVNPQISLWEIQNGERITLHVKRGKDIISSEHVIIYQADYLPTMYINTSNGNLEYIHSSKDNKEHASFTLYKADGEIDSFGECVLKGRGNSSWEGGMDGIGQKKPYNIKLATESSLLGMDSQLKWTLLACYDDQAFIRNKIALELAQRLGCEFSPQAEFINLYANGEYKGLYLLTQRIDVDGGCVHIRDLEQINAEINTAREYETYDYVESNFEKHATMFNNTPDDISGGYLLEFDSRISDGTGWFTTERNTIGIKSPNPVSVEQINYIADYMREAENLIFDTNMNTSTENNYLDYVDINSWAKMYVLQDFLLNFDVNCSSFYVYKKANDNLIYAGPLWDFDLSMGNIHVGEYMEFTKQVQWIEGNDNRLWLNALMNKPEFSAVVQDIYQNNFWNLLTEMVANDIPLWIEQLETSANMDAVLWEKENYNFVQKTSAVLEWMNSRKQFLTEYHANPQSYHKAIFKLDQGRSLIYCVKKGENLGYIPDFEGYEWVDEMGNIVDIETVINKDRVFIPKK